MNASNNDGVFCKKCGSNKFHEQLQTFKNDSSHVRVSCLVCDAFIQFKRQSKSAEELAVFEIPFGKYKGQSLKDIYLVDPNYLLWLKANTKDNVQRRIEEFLKIVDGLAL